jgi:hypothetical protein
MLKHLNAKAGVRYYLAEVDYCQAYFLNKYLNTGNESFLNKVFEPWINEAQWGSEEFYAKIKKIYQLNASLPATRRIRFLGVDKIQSVETVKAFLRDFLAEINYQPTPGSQIDSLQTYLLGEAAPKEAIGRVAGKVLDDLDRKEAFYRQILGDGCATFRHFIQNVAYLDSAESRDALMLRNLTYLTGNWGWPARKCTASGATTTPYRPPSGSACPLRPSSKGRTCPSATASCRSTSFRWAAT